MKNELKNQLAEVLGSITKGMSNASDFAIEQLPDIAQQYIMFGRVSETSMVLIALIALAFSVGMVRTGFKWPDEHNYDDGRGTLMLLAGLCFSLVSVIVAFAHVKSMMLVWFAPKVYLIQGIAGLLK